MVTDFYEAMHTTSGEPLTQLDLVLGNLQSFRRGMGEELTMIHEAVVQYLEDHDYPFSS
jgi:hypothetical protein